MRPRATDDIDMILVVEKMTPEFGQRFWEFIDEGKYENLQRKREDKEPVTELFRFLEPKNGFPVQIELLSKYPDVLGVPTGFHLTPIPVGEEIPSLSAILLDEEYYRHTIDSSIIEEGICIANPLSLLCLKVKAFLNLTEEKKINPNVRSADIKKHRDDVFKLLAMRIDPFTPVELSATMKDEVSVFINTMEESLPNQSLRDSLQRTDDDIRGFLGIMKEIFGIE
ncbi:hypothetical protein DW701_17000 [Bacteroides eggerthii]|jgi:hypothetical protein|uniref:Nucleotidyl transferase AbiEii/AbiGii toxin family protein n=1 Tax=Bacteroides eggerthii TaxID=28111 RepID=A0A414M2B6_9BACE|nr:hypothetical protein [Bacteroides eggerthii]EFV67933.1 hypothetical protein HMPREF9011_01619 [Bacteroides sp. 3_1_40A]RHF02569.1 hypothetical protein DW701_17000 [Bacteroides eggerthii]